MSTSKPLLPRTSTVRIPLDYYQILGVSFDATPEQIQQSYEDRLQQLPKQQYSAAAIASRKKLLLEAHSILLNPKRRQEHDQNLYPEMDTPGDDVVGESSSPITSDKGVEIDATFLAGALILLLEFGEFNSVLELGLTHLNRPIDLRKMPDDVGPVDDDVTLAVSIANLELGREYWQQGDCEEAGQSLQAGLKLLRDEGKFLDIQAEIETDLSKLRPYRVIDLLALDETDSQRAEGLSLLQDMLDERGGMEGHGDDQSGLSVNDFLLFMQQLRDNLTVDEQFNLFRAESMRPSSVATYLSVYAHVARGVSEYEPSFISQAKSLLAGLADRQDLSLEQGMCSLLLGQPDAATYCVEQSTDEEAIAFITDYSEGAPDIIPGLYLYTEQWLQQEVFPYFRNLNGQTVTLESYFNDEGVQHQLSDLEPDLPNVDATWDSSEVDAKWEQWLTETTQGEDSDLSKLTDDPRQTQGSRPTPQEDDSKTGAAKSPGNWFSAFTSPKSASPRQESAAEEDLTNLQWAQDLPTNSEDLQPSGPPQKSTIQTKPLSGKNSSQKPGSQSARKTEATSAPPGSPQPSRSARPAAVSAKKPWVPWGASLLLGISVVWGMLAIGRLFQSSQSPSDTPGSDSSQPSNPQASDSETGNPVSPGTSEDQAAEETETDTGELTPEAAQEIIRAWQKIKSEAMGKSYQKEALGQLLIGAELDDWERRVDLNQEEGMYTTFNLKNITIESVTTEGETEALVRAKVEESRDEYWGEASTPRASLDDSYQVDYRLELIDGKWKIKSTEVL